MRQLAPISIESTDLKRCAHKAREMGSPTTAPSAPRLPQQVSRNNATPLFSITDTDDFMSVNADLTTTNPMDRMSPIQDFKSSKSHIADMKRDESPLLPPARIQEARDLGEKLARLRTARRLRQADAAARAGLSRSTAILIEKGDIGRTQAQILRYLEAIAPGLTLLSLLQETDPSLAALSARERTQRVRALSPTELNKLDF